MPRVVLLGGPNGAGKTTVAPRVLRDYLSLREYVNADTLAAGLSAFNPESVGIEAGRVMLRRLRALVNERADFAFETTLASRSFAPFLEECRKGGYETTVVFLWLPSADLAVERVLARVRTGGHSVPEPVIRRRFATGWRNFLDLYRQVSDDWQLFENSSAAPSLIASGGRQLETEVFDPLVWEVVRRGPQKP